MTRSNRTSPPTRHTDVNEPRGSSPIDGAAGPRNRPERVVAPEHGRGQVDDVAVDEAGVVEGVGHGRSALDEDLQDAASAELVERRAEVAGQFEARVRPGRRPAPARARPAADRARRRGAR